MLILYQWHKICTIYFFVKEGAHEGLPQAWGRHHVQLNVATQWHWLSLSYCSANSRKVKALVTQLCLTLCETMGCTPPGSSVHGILQARILEWTAMTSSRESFQPRDRTQVSHTTGRFFTIWATRKASPQIQRANCKITHRFFFTSMRTGTPTAAPGSTDFA